MIIGYLDNWKRYEKQLPPLKEIAEFVRVSGEKEPGRYETEWGFYNIVEGTTLEMTGREFECHRNYIDVQCIAEGEEYMEWADVRDLEESVPYCEERDIQMMKGKGSVCRIQKGMFYAVYPEDAHIPGGHRDVPFQYCKVVAKVRI